MAELEASAASSSAALRNSCGVEAARLRLLRELRLNRPSDLAPLVAAAEAGALPGDVATFAGGRELVAALGADRAAALEILRHAAGLPAPPKASAKRKLESVVCCGDWEPADAPVLWETATVDVGGGVAVTLDQCASNYFCSGCRVWASAVVLARHLRLREPHALTGLDVLELGAGVGLVARVARVWGLAGRVLATDREPRLMEALAKNAGGAARILDWSDDVHSIRARFPEVDVVLGADLVYSSGAVAAGLLDCGAALLKAGGVLLLCCPAGRHGLVDLVAALRGDARWRDVRSDAVDAALLAGLEAHPFLLIRATRSDRTAAPDASPPRASSPGGGPETRR